MSLHFHALLVTGPNLGQSSERREPVGLPLLLPLPPLLFSVVQGKYKKESSTPQEQPLLYQWRKGLPFLCWHSKQLGTISILLGAGDSYFVAHVVESREVCPPLLLLWPEKAIGSDFICAC